MEGYITLDYELGMGVKTGTPELCLFAPMKYLTEMLDKYGIKTNIFVDAAYLLRIRQLKNKFPQLQKDYDEVTSHISELDEKGHAIQLHLHPQWCYSSFNGEEWILDKDHYKLSDMPLDEQKNLIHDGVQLLNSLIKRKVTAFRAGGYSVENFPELYNTFLQEGIMVDTSVLRGEMYKSKYQTYDYRSIPKKTSYKFFGTLKKENIEGEMTEYPISVKRLPYILYFLKRLFNRSKMMEAQKKWGDGIGIGYPGGKKQMILTNLKMLTGMKSLASYIEFGYYLEEVYSYSKRHYTGNDFVIIGHPKILAPYTINCLEQFILNHPEITFKLF